MTAVWESYSPLVIDFAHFLLTPLEATVVEAGVGAIQEVEAGHQPVEAGLFFKAMSAMLLCLPDAVLKRWNTTDMQSICLYSATLIR